MCSNGKIPSAVRKGRIWLIPKDTPKPIDGRTKAAKQNNNSGYFTELKGGNRNGD